MLDTQFDRDSRSESGLAEVRRLGTFLSVGFAAMALTLVALVLPSIPMHAQDAPVNDKLEMVVAVFRHGIRPPLKTFACGANQYSGKTWPALPDWHAIPDQADLRDGSWGNLTIHGKLLAKALGQYYKRKYSHIVRPDGREVYFWADVDERTHQTALGLKEGFCSNSPSPCLVQLDGGDPSAKDPLFHPFASGCGNPDYTALKSIADTIRNDQADWFQRGKFNFQILQTTLNCQGEQNPVGCPASPQKCTPIMKKWQQSPDTAQPGCKPPGCTQRESDPLRWSGVFSYASGASEAFLLEYANNMPPGQVAWGRTKPSDMGHMLELHEFFFDKTQREDYIAKIQGSNLVREILDDLERGAGLPSEGCPHGGAGSRFIGLVGHDTNLASVGKLLNLNWNFDATVFKNIPSDDALPAGALVFELRDRGSPDKPDLFVRIVYVTLTPEQMQSYRPPAPVPEPVRLNVTGPDCGARQCDISLARFKEIAKPDQEFLSSCRNGRQVCSLK